MFRSLHMKLVLVLVLLTFSVMAVVGTFLVNSITEYNITQFLDQMESVFTPEFILNMENSATGGADDLHEMLEAFSAPLGIDQNRLFFILDGATGDYLAGSDDSAGQTLPMTPNMLAALNGEVGQTVQRLGDYFDVAIPVRSGDNILFVAGVLDDKTELEDLTWNLVTILIRAMLFGLIVAVLLSFLLGKTITNPVERLTKHASQIAAGDFSGQANVQSTDEIGILTETFNEMAGVLESTLLKIGEERNKLDTLFQHMADGVVAFDAEGKLLHINPAARTMLGKNIDDGMTYADVFPNMHVEPSDRKDDKMFIEVDYSAKSRMLKIFFAPINVGGTSEGMMAVLHDITEQKKLDESRREFVANVSHELRTPLTNIRSYTETLLMGGDIDEQTEKRFLGVISGEADRMSRIVKDLLTLSRLDHDRMEMSMAPIDLGRLAIECSRAMELEAKSKQVEIFCDTASDMYFVNADRERMEQVLINIISNAIKYNRTEGTVTVSLTGDTQQVSLSVADSGIGIPEDDLPHIFERFYRVDKARSRESGGTGLGLAIARQIVQYHDGKIDFTSKQGVGTTVTVTLPRIDKGEEQA